jgi:hypothetical protein
MDSVFPVSFQLLSLDGSRRLSDWIQGFTNNIGKGGFCLAINNLNPELAKLIKSKQVKLSLDIDMPLSKTPVLASAKVVWVKDIIAGPNKYLIGLAYERIDRNQNNKIMRYARTKKLFAPAVFTIIIILFLIFAINTYINIKLIQGNKALVEQLVKIIQDSSIAKQKVKSINREREDLQFKMQTLELRIQNIQTDKDNLEKIVKLEKSQSTKKIEELSALIEKLTQDKGSLQEELDTLQKKEDTVTQELLRLDKQKAQLEKANLDKMYQWIKIHQNPRSGLIMSFEGDNNIANWAFIYDQSLAIQAYINFGDFERARKMLDFFAKKAQRQQGAFFNAYYADDGSPAEYIVHSGPNIWLGIAASQYTKKTRDNRYLALAQDIATNIISLQNQDQDGGIRGGPDVNWYSTEHNLDAYAFFNMLYKITAKKLYLDAREKTLNWLIQHTYDKADIPIKRGKGDSTIATDTYAWAIAAVGPEKLEELGMSPDRILEFAEQNCAVEVTYIRPEGQAIKIKGFDFAPQRHVARGGVVSSEWTAQMVLAFNLMSDFEYKKGIAAKAHTYRMKADEYLAELGRMIISSPSPSGQGESCLPYATQDSVDTGHGWMTPKGKSTGSVAGTTYALFAYYNYNPLELKE